ncbi:MAG: hypothetical protein ACI9TH_001996 [Kiritimatiellia bacterium]|jgi:hypothetical protein
MKKPLYLLLALCFACSAEAADYVIAVRKVHATSEAWKPVVDALQAKYADATVLTFDDQPEEMLDGLKKLHPRFTCFVSPHEEVTRAFVKQVHIMTRAIDDDPYTDTLWGILTGYDAANALRIAKQKDPLTIRKVGSGTEFATEMVEEGVWYCELVKNRMVIKQAGKEAREEKGPDDTTLPLVNLLNEYESDLFITSGHATERDWQIGFRYRNGSFRSHAGHLYGLDTQKQRHPIESPNPKVYLPIGNCLMGHINGPDSMALAWMNSAGVHQMIGYTVETWFGYGGWGCLDYFVEQPGRYTFTEAFFANHHALIHTLQHEPSRGLAFDRDVVVLYGDPAWEARMADRPKAWDQQLEEKDGLFTFTLTPNRGVDTFTPVNLNGAQRGHRPIVELFPFRLTGIEVIEDHDLNALVADDFLLIPNPEGCDPKRTYAVTFKASRL